MERVEAEEDQSVVRFRLDFIVRAQHALCIYERNSTRATYLILH